MAPTQDKCHNQCTSKVCLILNLCPQYQYLVSPPPFWPVHHNIIIFTYIYLNLSNRNTFGFETWNRKLIWYRKPIVTFIRYMRYLRYFMIECEPKYQQDKIDNIAFLTLLNTEWYMKFKSSWIRNIRHESISPLPHPFACLPNRFWSLFDPITFRNKVLKLLMVLPLTFLFKYSILSPNFTYKAILALTINISLVI